MGFVAVELTLLISFLALCAVVPNLAIESWTEANVALPVTLLDKTIATDKDAAKFHTDLKTVVLNNQISNEKLFLMRREGNAMAALVKEIAHLNFDQQKYVVYMCGEGDMGKEGALAAIESKKNFRNVKIVLSGLPDGTNEKIPEEYRAANRDFLDVLEEAYQAGVEIVFVDTKPIQNKYSNDKEEIKFEDISDFLSTCGAIVESIKGFPNKSPIETKHKTMMNIVNEATRIERIHTFSSDTIYGVNASTGEIIAMEDKFFISPFQPVKHILFMIVAKNMYKNHKLHANGCMFYLWSSVFVSKDLITFPQTPKPAEPAVEPTPFKPVPAAEKYEPKIQLPYPHDTRINAKSKAAYTAQMIEYGLSLPLELVPFVTLPFLAQISAKDQK